jgi:hypothetical protein
MSWFDVARAGVRSGLMRALMLVLSFSFAGCSRQAPPEPDAATRLQNIAPSDGAKYPSPHDAKHWSNPYLIIGKNGVGLITGITANEEQILKPEEVLDALARLPASAWPYGRAVAILDETPGAADADKPVLRRSRGMVAGELQAAHVAINWISAP